MLKKFYMNGNVRKPCRSRKTKNEAIIAAKYFYRHLKNKTEWPWTWRLGLGFEHLTLVCL